MDTFALLQHYWWLIISVLGALLVFLLFVQGGQTMIYSLTKNEDERNLLVNSLGHKWEFTFTTLVTFGGAFFASFPLFYSTSFGGAYYVWMVILLAFVIQAVSYEYRRKPHNIFGERTYNTLLIINGVLGPLLLGTAVGTFFFGADFTVNRFNIALGAGAGDASVISQWSSPWHGLEAVTDVRNLLLGLAVLFLSMMLACQYFMNNIDDKELVTRIRKRMVITAVPFLVFFLAFFIWLLFSNGWAVDSAGQVSIEPYKYLHNFLAMPYVTVVLLVGVVLVLWSIWQGMRKNHYRSAIWYGGFGTVLTVLALLLCAGWNNTAFYPSLTDTQSSLTIANASSSQFTLKAMSIVSILVPFVIAYIWYAWRAMNRTPLTRKELQEELREGDAQY